ncbi:MAG: dihydroorotate dehydrogenase electron transfer subunit [Clostridia bacterium]|nr:dihydroorotate dehydrogenase electron transfer subunit [Clostridia bacterium]
MSKVLKEKIVAISKLAQDIYKMTFLSRYVAKNSMPGQFVNINCQEGIDALLRRPISICSVDRQLDTFDIVFQVKGAGTEYLAKKQLGDEIDMIGPLGKPFTIFPKNERVAVVGGGIGIFPLHNLLKECRWGEKKAFLGFRSAGCIVMESEFKSACDELFISTDDGSIGHKGLVTDLLEQEIQNGSFDIIYTCGPTPMIKKVAEIAAAHGIKCQVSLEQRMGCGIGACLVCACKTKSGDGWQYSHVCKDGPVFWSDEVIFDEP